MLTLTIYNFDFGSSYSLKCVGPYNLNSYKPLDLATIIAQCMRGLGTSSPLGRTAYSQNVNLADEFGLILWALIIPFLLSRFPIPASYLPLPTLHYTSHSTSRVLDLSFTFQRKCYIRGANSTTLRAIAVILACSNCYNTTTTYLLLFLPSPLVSFTRTINTKRSSLTNRFPLVCCTYFCQFSGLLTWLTFLILFSVSSLSLNDSFTPVSVKKPAAVIDVWQALCLYRLSLSA